MIERNTVQAVSILLALIGFAVYTRLALRYPRYGLYLAVPALYALLVTAFYIGVFLREFGFFPGVSFGDLSAWLRLVEIMVFAGFGVLLSLRQISIRFGWHGEH